jgi:uncharacterized protein (TIGR02246 family)
MSVRSISLALLALALTSTAGQLPAQEAAGLSDEDVAAIRGNSDTYTQLTLAGDFAGLAAMFTEDAVRMPPNAPALEGRTAIQAFAEAYYSTITEFESTTTEVGGAGDVAFARGTYSLTATPEGALEPVSDSGKWMAICKRQPDGTWLMTANIWNSDLPLPE